MLKNYDLMLKNCDLMLKKFRGTQNPRNSAFGLPVNDKRFLDHPIFGHAHLSAVREPRSVLGCGLGTMNCPQDYS